MFFGNGSFNLGFWRFLPLFIQNHLSNRTFQEASESHFLVALNFKRMYHKEVSRQFYALNFHLTMFLLRFLKSTDALYMWMTLSFM